jgi:flagellar motor component MotA
MTRFIATILAVAFLALAVLLHSPLRVFLDLTSALLLVGVGGACWFGAFGGGGVRMLLQTMGDGATPAAYREAAEVARAGATCFIYSGWVGMLLGAVMMLQRLDDPSTIGPAVAVALLSPLYGLLAALLLWVPAERSRLAKATH